MTIATKMGDFGKSRLLSGESVSKADRRIVCCGVLDSLMSHIGYARSLCACAAVKPKLGEIQKDLLLLGAEIASSGKRPKPKRLSAMHLARIEKCLHEIESELPTKRTFTLPGISVSSSALHLARTTCRHLESLVVGLYEKGMFNNKTALRYLNRLSDLLFLFSRFEEEYGSFLLVFSTTNSKEEATRLAELLVGKRLAACVNITSDIRSVYKWKKRLFNEDEFLMIIKTRAARLEELKEELRRHHLYEVPEIIALPITDGLPEYLDWLSKNT